MKTLILPSRAFYLKTLFDAVKKHDVLLSLPESSNVANNYLANVVNKLFKNIKQDKINYKQLDLNKTNFVFTLEDGFNELIKNYSAKQLESLLSFKDKAIFREKISRVYPDIWFKILNKAELKTSKFDRFPFVLQVSVGFGSKGVEIIHNPSELYKIDLAISSAEQGEKIFSKSVVDSSKWIVCQFFEGDEYAVDAFITSKGIPVITGIYKHIFKDENDVTDRLYYTSKSVMFEFLPKTTDFLSELVKIYPEIKQKMFHLEFKYKNTHIMPIELNMFRFGGYGLSQLPYHAFKINPYDYYLNDKAVDWNTVLKNTSTDYFFWVLGAYPDNKGPDNLNISLLEKTLKTEFLDFVYVNTPAVFFSAYNQTSDYEELEKWLKHDFKVFFN